MKQTLVGLFSGAELSKKVTERRKGALKLYIIQLLRVRLYG